jgi:hypothetical protein
MKAPCCLLAAVLFLQSLFAQTSAKGIDGVWQGALLFGQGKIRVVLHVAPSRDGVYSGAMINLADGEASNVDLITFADSKVALELKHAGFKFAGTLSPSGNEIRGKFTQDETSGDLTFTRESAKHSRIADDYEKKEFRSSRPKYAPERSRS